VKHALATARKASFARTRAHCAPDAEDPFSGSAPVTARPRFTQAEEATSARACMYAFGTRSPPARARFSSDPTALP
jgi:hypothetical protein